MAIAVRCVVRAPPKTSVVVRRAGAAQDESGDTSCGRRSRRVWWRPSFRAVFLHQHGNLRRYTFFRGRRVHLRRLVHRGASKGSTAHESLSCKQVYGHHFLGAPHVSSFCFSGERRRWRHRWRVLPSLVVLSLPLPLPLLSRRDRLKLGLALCSCYARARDLRSPNNVQVAAFPTEYCSIVIIASISIMSYQDLRTSQSTI